MLIDRGQHQVGAVGREPIVTGTRHQAAALDEADSVRVPIAWGYVGKPCAVGGEGRDGYSNQQNKS